MFKEAARFIFDRTVIRLLKYIKNKTGDQTGVQKVLWARAGASSADYIEKHLSTVLLFPDRKFLWDHALARAKTEGLFMEIGVWSGSSINTLATRLPGKTIYGFDSFEGLKEDYPGTGFSK